jgi:hypothetical protein
MTSIGLCGRAGVVLGELILVLASTVILRMASSGTLCRVALVRTDVSEKHSASFIRVTRMGELGAALAVTSNRRISSQHALVARYS